MNRIGDLDEIVYDIFPPGRAFRLFVLSQCIALSVSREMNRQSRTAPACFPRRWECAYMQGIDRQVLFNSTLRFET